jgi:hypothetical protein
VFTMSDIERNVHGKLCMHGDFDKGWCGCMGERMVFEICCMWCGRVGIENTY